MVGEEFADMNRMIVHSKVDPDGVLRLTLPIGAIEANHDLQITIESAGASSPSAAEYHRWIESVAGQWQGEFERMPIGEFESRDAL
jgi:hypothetical protein